MRLVARRGRARVRGSWAAREEAWGRSARLLVFAITALGIIALAASQNPERGRGTDARAGLASVSTDTGITTVDGPGLLEPLNYSIRTRYATNPGHCPGSSTRLLTTAVIGVPTAVDLGGSALADVVVTLAVVPAVGDGADVVELAITKLRADSLYGLVEAVLAPTSGAPDRVTLGYDGCEAGAPSNFSTTVTSRSTQLSLTANTHGAGPALTLLGSVYDDVRTRALDARLAPVPQTLSAVVDVVEEGSYRATLRPSTPAVLRVRYRDVEATARTEATLKVDRLPSVLRVAFDPTQVSYDACPVDELGVSVCQRIARLGVEVKTQADEERTALLGAELVDLPPRATLSRASETAVQFTTDGGPIGSTAVRFSSHEPTVTPPALAPLAGQYLVADVGLAHAVAAVQVSGLERFDVDAGDPLVVDVTHTPGPFHVHARVTTRRAPDCAGCPPPNPPTETRTVTGRVLDLPARARVEFSPSTQAFAYTGSAVIGELGVEVVSTIPFVDDARHAGLLARGVPTGLHGQLHAAAKTFEATLVNGAVALVEVQVHSGDEERLPEGVDGVRVEDHVGSYAAFARVSGLRHVAVGWSELHQFADVHRTAGPFHLLVDVDDTDTKDIEIDGRLLDLPAQARFDHIPSKPLQCPTQPCGDTPLSITFATVDPTATIGRLTFDVVSGAPLIDAATIAHVTAADLPPLSISVDTTGKRFVATTTRGTLGSIGIELCSATGCGLLGTTGSDGAFLVDLQGGVYDAVVRLNGLRRAEVAWGTSVLVDVDHAAGPFDVFVEQDYQVAVPNDPNQPPAEPCDLPKPRDCEIVDDDEPPPPDTTLVTFHRSLNVEARDLPTSVRLTYDPEAQHVGYVGSSEIGSLEAHYSDGRALVGRARFAHLVVEDIPTNLDLVFAFSDAGDVLTADTGGGVLGRLELELLSATELLAAVNQSPGFRDGFDGLVYWDLSDFEGSAVEPIDDAFAIAVRVSGLQRLDYRRGPYSDGTFDHNRVAVDLRRAPTPTRPILPSLWAEIQKADQTRAARAIPGLGNYRAELMNLDYAGPPDHLGFEFDELKRGAHTLYHLRYHGSSAGDQARFVSNVGPGGDFRPLIDFTAAPVPGGGDSLAAPGVFACIAPNSMRCGDTNDPDFQTEQLSVKLEVTEPMLLNGVYSGDEIKVLVQDVHIDAGMVASTETNNDGATGLKSTLVYLDTRSATVTGTVRVVKENFATETDDTHVHVAMPEGFMALGRQVEMEYEGTGPRSFGRAVCPAGTLLTSDSFGKDVNLEGRFCPAARVDSVELDGVATPSLAPGTHQLLLRGTNFVPWLSGNVGTRVFILSTNALVPPLEAHAVEWIDISTIRATIIVPEGWETGPHAVGASNPIDTTLARCHGCVVLVDA